MIRVIFGEKGTGKTKQIIDMANEAIKSAKGSIVFIDSDSQYMYEVKSTIRYVDASEYHIEGPKMFFGFISGMAAQDFDLECLYIDRFMNIVHHPLETLEGLFADLVDFTERTKIDLVISISGEAAAPAFIKPFMV